MARTHKKVRYRPEGKGGELTPTSVARGVEEALKILEGRWKLMILFHLFGGKVLRFSTLERAIPGHFPEDADPAASPDGSRRNRPAHRPPPGSAQGRVLPDGLGPGPVPGARRLARVGGAVQGDVGPGAPA